MDNNAPEGEPISNEKYRDTEIDVWNGRTAANADEFHVHRTGFCIRQHLVPLPPAPSSDDLHGINAWVLEHALPRACDLVLKELGEGAVGAAVFDYTMRFEVPPKDPPPQYNFRGPVAGAHGDFTDKSGPLRLHKILTNEDKQGIITSTGSVTLADANLDRDKYRIVFINVWQPLRDVHKRALALCDVRTTSLSNIYERCFIFKERRGYTYSVEYNSKQKWYYFPNMTPQEALLLKVFDTESRSPEFGSHYATPHSGLKEVGTEGRTDLPPRESIEIRTAVILKKPTSNA